MTDQNNGKNCFFSSNLSAAVPLTVVATNVLTWLRQAQSGAVTFLGSITSDQQVGAWTLMVLGHATSDTNGFTLNDGFDTVLSMSPGLDPNSPSINASGKFTVLDTFFFRFLILQPACFIQLTAN